MQWQVFRQSVQFFCVINCSSILTFDKGFQCYLGGKAISAGTSHGAWLHGPPILQLHPLAIYPFSLSTFSKLPRKTRKKTSAKKTHHQRTHTSSSTPFFGGGSGGTFSQGKKWFSESSDLLDSLNPNVKKMKMCPTKARLFIWALIETHELSYHHLPSAQRTAAAQQPNSKSVKIRICQNISTLARNWILRWRKGLGAKFGRNDGEFDGRFNRWSAHPVNRWQWLSTERCNLISHDGLLDFIYNPTGGLTCRYGGTLQW